MTENLTLQKIINLKSHSLQKEKLLLGLKTKEGGLTENQFNSRLLKFGPNKLRGKKNYSVLSLITEQFTDLLVIILLLAGGFSFFISSKISFVP